MRGISDRLLKRMTEHCQFHYGVDVKFCHIQERVSTNERFVVFSGISGNLRMQFIFKLMVNNSYLPAKTYRLTDKEGQYIEEGDAWL